MIKNVCPFYREEMGKSLFCEEATLRFKNVPDFKEYKKHYCCSYGFAHCSLYAMKARKYED